MHDHIETYNHRKRIGVIVHLACADDFSARTDVFLDLAKSLAMQIAATDPMVVAGSNLDPEIRNNELKKIEDALEGKDENERLKFIEKENIRINEQYCLLDQAFIKDPSKRVSEMIDEVSQQLRGNVQVLRFIRIEANET